MKKKKKNKRRRREKQQKEGKGNVTDKMQVAIEFRREIKYPLKRSHFYREFDTFATAHATYWCKGRR